MKPAADSTEIVALMRRSPCGGRGLKRQAMLVIVALAVVAPLAGGVD